MDDPLLQQYKQISSGGFQYSFVAIPKRVILVVSSYIELIWMLGGLDKDVHPASVLENIKSIFINEKKDSLWKEHCAASLRELVDGHFETNLSRFLKCIPSRSESLEAEEVYKKIAKYKDIFNELAHLRIESATKTTRDLFCEDTIMIDELIFDRICTGFIYLLEGVFKKNCMRGN